MRTISVITVYLFLLLSACSKEAEIISPDPLNPHQETFISSLFVEIIDLAGQPIPASEVQIGNRTAITNQFGIAAFSKIALGRSNYVTANAPGFMAGSRRFYSAPGSSDFVRIRMLSDKPGFTFSAHSGSTLFHPQGARIQFPANAYTLSTGVEYTGEVQVAFRVLQADDPYLNELMPGDLVGINQNNETGVLGSFGMMAVEITGEQGEALQLVEGSVAIISIDIPADLQATAPASIPLWYFDETVGAWKEEGTAIRNGNVYEGTVTHFSFWNYDAFLSPVHLDLRFQRESGALQYHKVCLNIISLNTKSCSSTNEFGHVGGPVAANELIEVQVYSDCGDLLYEDVIGPFTVDTELPAITVLESGYVPLSITGVGVNCIGIGISNGFIALEVNGNTGFYPLGIGGAIDVSIPLCEPAGVAIQLFDFDANKESEKFAFEYSPVIDLHQVVVCHEANQNFATIIPENFDVNRYYFLKTRVVEGYTQIFSPESADLSFRISVYGTAAGHYSDANGLIQVRTDLDDSLFATQFTVTIDSYGGPGEMIHGTVSGTLISNDPGTGITVPFTGEFSARRDP